MKELEKVECAECARDITTGGNHYDYRIVVKNEEIPPSTCAVVDIMVMPELEKELHFCGLRCLESYFMDSGDQG